MVLVQHMKEASASYQHKCILREREENEKHEKEMEESRKNHELWLERERVAQEAWILKKQREKEREEEEVVML